jgi:hypothetical protein
MKRILAVFLTLAMALNIAPVAAFAAADSDAASIVAVEETDETSSPQLDEETARAIASDPFLQAAYAQTEQEQTGQAEVDTSNMSVSATNSFGQLLVNGLGMDGENGSDLSSESRVIEITMNGSTAMVKYIVKKDANLVVGIYTDDSEQEMIASGTVAVQATPDNTASSIVEVPLSGEIPEHYTVKGFLLDKEDHAPLCREYTNAFYTENVEELEGATIDDFDSARAVNLDDDRTTNFGVVKQGVILLQEDEPENGAGENIVVLDDSENQIYQFENASTELLNLKQGNIIVYKYGENNLIIAHVADFEINGTTVTIYGDEDFQLEDVFSILKMDGENTTDKAIVDTETGDGKVSYIGTQEIETLDSTNEWEGKAEFSHVFKISTDDGKDEDSEEKPVSGSVEGTVSIKAAIKLKLRLCDDNKMVSLSFPMTEKFELEGAVEYKGELLKFPKITLPVYGCLSVGFEPQMVFKANASVAFKMDSTQMIGFEWSQKDGTQDISEAPVTSINFKLSGSIYLGFDMAPKAELGVGKVSLVKLKFKAEAGFELSAEERLGDQGTGLDEIHGCKNCYEGELEFKITLGVSLKILLYEPKIEITPFSHSFGKAYASADYGDFGWGECPHVKYRLTLKAGKAGAGATVKIQSNDSDTSSLYTETTLDADGNSTVYLPGREYRITANKGSMEFVKTIKLSRGTTVNIDLEQGSTGGNPGTTEPEETIVASGTCGDDLTWKLGDKGTLTISGTGEMYNYSMADAPWKEQKDLISALVVENGATSIGSSTFDGYTSLKSIKLASTVKSIGNNAFSNTGITSLDLPEGMESIGIGAFYNCEKMTELKLPESLTTLNNGAFAFCKGLTAVTLPNKITFIGALAFEECTGLTSITIPENVTEIRNQAFYYCTALTMVELPKALQTVGDNAFYETKLQDVYYAGTEEDWGKIAIGLKNEPLTNANLHCMGAVVVISGTCGGALTWKLDSKGTLTISGTGAMTDYTKSGVAPWNKDCEEIRSVVIENGVTTIGEYAFENCTLLESVAISDSVEKIGKYAFSGCSALKRISLPDSIAQIGDCAFRASGLEAVKIPEGVTLLGEGMFARCPNLQTVELPSTLQAIRENAFIGSGLNKIVLPENLKDIGYECFYECTNLEEIKIPDSVTILDYAVFEGCSSLKKVTLSKGLKRIGQTMFARCHNLTEITIPDSITYIGEGAFFQCKKLKDVYYTGSQEKWGKLQTNAAAGFTYWIAAATIHCTDGDIVPNTENSITTGAASASDSKFQATFADAKAGKEYVVLVSRSDSDPLNADNLIYINQITADADGELTVPFITAADAAEMTYVVACAQDDATVDPGQPDKPGKPDQPDQPGEDKPSSGDDGGGAAIILIGGVAAVAAVAGVVLMMPVKVEGTVKLADQPVANATVQVLKGDTVKAETVTDANGHFTVKVKRGGYTLRVQWTDASGQPVTRTVDFKAPNGNLNVAA